MATASRPAFDEPTQSEPEPAVGEESPAGSAPDEAREEGASPLDVLAEQFGELIAYATHYFSAQRDLTDLRLRRFLLRGASVAGFGFALLVGLGASAVFVLRGVAHGLGALLGDRMWAGELITGLTVFLAIALLQRMLSQQLRRTWRERYVTKYEQHAKR